MSNEDGHLVFEDGAATGALSAGALSPQDSDPMTDSKGIEYDFLDGTFAVSEVSSNGEPLVGAKVQVVKQPEGVSAAHFKSLLIAAQLAWTSEGVSNEDLEYLTGLNKKTVNEVTATPEFISACEHRGHPLNPKKGLTDRQMLALHYIVQDTTTPTLAGRLRHAGVTIKEYNQWRRSSTFRNELKRLGGQVLEDSEQDMLTTLAGLAVNGDQRAIEFAFELTGKHNPRAQEAINVALILNTVLEAIKDEVRDPDTLRRLSARIGIAAGAVRAQINSAAALEIETDLTGGANNG